MNKPNKMLTLVKVVYAVYVLLVLALASAGLYVIYHFVAKYW